MEGFSFILNGVDCSREVVTKEDSPAFAFPESTPTDDTLATEAMTGILSADRLPPVGFTVTHACMPGSLADADAVGAWISQRVRWYAPNATFYIAEKGKQALIGRVKNAYAVEHKNFGTWGWVTISGTRYGAWEDVETSALDHAGNPITDYAVTLGGSVHISGTKGEMPARLRSKLTLDAGGDTAALAFTPWRALTEYLVNPAFADSDSNGVPDGWAPNANVHGTPVYSITNGVWRVAYTGVSGDSGNYINFARQVGQAASFAPGDVAVLRALVTASGAGSTQALKLYANDSSGAVIGSPVTVSVPNTTGQIVEVRMTCPANTDSVACYFTANGIDNGDTLTLTIAYPSLTKLADWCNTLQDYAGAHITMAGSYAPVGSAQTFDVNDYRGKWLPVAKVTQTSTTAGATHIQAGSNVTGSNITATGSYLGQSVASAKLDGSEEVMLLGPLPIPGVEVPDLETGSGLGTAGEIISQKTGSTVVNDVSNPSQTFTPLRGSVVTGVILKGSGGGKVVVDAFSLDGKKCFGYSNQITVPSSAAEFTVPFVTSFTASGAQIFFRVSLVSGSVSIYQNLADVYPGGAYSLNGAPNGDLYFAILGRLPLGFGASIAISAKCSDSSKVCTLGKVSLLPWAFYESVKGTFAAGQGPMIDNLPADQKRRLVYLASATGGVGPASGYTRQTGQRGAYLPAGDSECVTAGNGSTGKLTLTYVPLYATRGGN